MNASKADKHPPAHSAVVVQACVSVTDIVTVTLSFKTARLSLQRTVRYECQDADGTTGMPHAMRAAWRPTVELRMWQILKLFRDRTKPMCYSKVCGRRAM
jgi:hypothetical protein